MSNFCPDDLPPANAGCLTNPDANTSDDDDTASSSSESSCSDDESCINMYAFYIYHDAAFNEDDDNCMACDELVYCDDPMPIEDIYASHNEYDETVDEAMSDIRCYSRQKFIANLKKSTYDRLTSEAVDMRTVLFALANMSLWGSIDEEAGLDDLSEDEIVEDASDDMYVCYVGDDGVERDMVSYFREHKIHLNIIGSDSSSHGEWHVNGLHPCY